MRCDVTKPSELLALCVVFTHRRFWVPSPIEHYRMSSSPVMSHLRQVDSEYFHFKVTKKFCSSRTSGWSHHFLLRRLLSLLKMSAGFEWSFLVSNRIAKFLFCSQNITWLKFLLEPEMFLWLTPASLTLLLKIKETWELLKWFKWGGDTFIPGKKTIKAHLSASSRGICQHKYRRRITETYVEFRGQLWRTQRLFRHMTAPLHFSKSVVAGKTTAHPVRVNVV